MAASALPVKGKPKLSLVRRVINAVVGSNDLPPTPRPVSPYELWGFERADQAISEAFESQTIDVSLNGESQNVTPAIGQPFFFGRRNYTNPIITNRLFFQGDHWQNGDGWIGPRPEQSNDSFETTMQEIANLFTSKNVVREATMRHALGVVGRSIQWGFAPLDEPEDPSGKPPQEVQDKMKEAARIIRPWLQNRKVQTLLRDAVCTLLLSERAGIQLTIPPGLAQKDTAGNLVINAKTIAEALSYIYPEHPLPDNAAVFTDKDTMQEAGIWRYTMSESGDDDEKALAEGGSKSTTGEEEDSTYVAICFVDQGGNTVIRVFEEDEADPSSETPLQMGGRIPMFEMRRAALITLQVQQGQRALNLAESMIPRTAVSAGFLERLLIDTQMPGEPEMDADGNPTGRWIEKPFYIGAGTTNFLQSSEYTDEEGKIKRASGKVSYREPSKAEGPITASDKHYRSILDETGQLHVVMAGDSNPSGTSRLNARIEYLSTLQLTQGEVETAFRFIVDTALAMAEALSKKQGYFTNVIRTQCACRLDAGPLQPAERAAIESSIGKTISQETAMMLCGIDDVEAEKARMAMDPMSQVSYGQQVGAALIALTSPGANLDAAAAFIGIPPERIAILTGGTPGDMQIGPGNPGPSPTPGSPTPGTDHAPTGVSRSEKKPAVPPSSEQRGPGKGGLKKLPAPTPATSSSGSSSGSGLPISGAK